MDDRPEIIALRFNHCVNSRDLEGLTALMTNDHTVIDTAGNTVRGREAMARAWDRFLQAFPDYPNLISQTQSQGDSVILFGRSECSEPAPHGPAIWKAAIRVDQVAEWRVDEDTIENRECLTIRPRTPKLRREGA